MPFRPLALAAVLAAALAAMPAQAGLLLPATNNATVQPAGPRTGVNGQRFFDVEGASNGSFASFGVVDFAASAAGVRSQSLTLTLTQANASFTANGGLGFYLATDTATSIDAGASPLRYQTTATPGGVGGQLAPTFLLGSGIFTQVADGTADAFTFALTGAERSYLDREIASAGLVRLIVAATDPGVAATYAGFSNTEFAGPTLFIDTALPEPGAVLLVVVGLAGVTLARRFRQV